MPAFKFAGFGETTFPFDRDATGQPVGTVLPGDVREFDEAPHLWVPVDGGGTGSGGTGGGDGGGQDPDGQAGDDPDASDPPVPDGPQPAPPAVIPGT